MYDVIDKGYLAIVLHENDRYLYIVAPHFNDSTKFVRRNETAIRNWVEFKRETNVNWWLRRIDAYDDSYARIKSFKSIRDAIQYIRDNSINSDFNSITENNMTNTNNPIDKAVYEAYFKNEANINELVTTAQTLEDNMAALDKAAVMAKEIKMKLDYVKANLNKYATAGNVTAVKETLSIAKKVNDAVGDSDILLWLVTAGKDAISKESKDFDVEEYLWLKFNSSDTDNN